jgi:putative SOS response-associated peptidase YedK
MCGRYILEDKKKTIFKRFKVNEPTWYNQGSYSASYNIAPGFIVPVVTRNSPNELQLMKWGLVPSWAKDPNIGFKLINARAESIAQKPSFKESFLKRRCLIPASGFYEWKHLENSKNKIPYLFTLKKDQLISFAGIYDIWKDAEGKEIKTFTIITTEPNSLMQPIHNRMPVILKENDEDIWLDSNSNSNILQTFLKPYDTSDMEAYTVSQEVNSPRNQGSNLIEKFKYPLS